jgi:hypothetical protein
MLAARSGFINKRTPSLCRGVTGAAATRCPWISTGMAADLQRTSYNMMIYEVRDFCTAVLSDRNSASASLPCACTNCK